MATPNQRILASIQPPKPIESIDKMVLQVRIKDVYGKPTIYPVNKAAQIFCSLLSQITLTKRDIDLIKDLGYIVEVVQDRVTL